MATQVRIGRYEGQTSGRSGTGEWRLPQSIRSLRIGDAVIGDNRRSRGGGVPSQAHGTIDFNHADALAVIIERGLAMAIGDQTSAHWENPPRQVDLRVGAPETPAVVRLAYKDRSQVGADAADHQAEASITLPAGQANLQLRELRIAHNSQPEGGAIGVLDLSGLEHAVVRLHGEPDSEVYVRPDLTTTPMYPTLERMLAAPVVTSGVVVIGRGVNGSGVLRLPPGELEASLILVGDAAGAIGELALRGTTVTVGRQLLIAAGGTVTLRLDRPVAGLRVRADTPEAFAVVSEGDRPGRLRLVFTPDGPKSAVHVAGDHVERLKALHTTGAIVAEDEAGQSVALDIRRDGADTIIARR